MMRALAVALTIVGLCGLAIAERLSSTATGAEPSYDVGRSLVGEAITPKLDLARKCGLTNQQLWMVYRVKEQERRNNEKLIRATEAMAVALQSDTDDPESRRQAVTEYLAVKEEVAATYLRLQDEVTKAVGADQDPVKLGALVVLGVVDSGRRVTCAINSAVSGGAAGNLKGGAAGAGLGNPPPSTPSIGGSNPRRLLRRQGTGAAANP